MTMAKETREGIPDGERGEFGAYPSRPEAGTVILTVGGKMAHDMRIVSVALPLLQCALHLSPRSRRWETRVLVPACV